MTLPTQSPEGMAASPIHLHGGRWWLRLLLWLVLVACLLPPLAYFVLGREAVLQTLVPMLLERAKLTQQVKLGGIHGSLWGPLTIESIDFSNGTDRLQVQQLTLDWQPQALLRKRLVLDRLQAKRVRYQSTSAGKMVFPQYLGLPPSLPLESLHIAALQVQEFEWRTSEQPLQLRELRLALSSSEGRWELAQGQVQSPWGRLQIAGSLQQQAPFALEAGASLALDPSLSAGLLHQAKLQLRGDLRHIHLDAQAALLAGKESQLQAQLDVNPFLPQPVRALKLNASHVNPAQWQPNYPQADISLALDLQHLAEQWRGQVQIQNTQSGAINAQRLPIQSITAQLTGNDAHLQLEQLLLELGTGGQFRGRADWQPSAAQFQVALHTNNLNLQGFDTRMKAGKIIGDVVLGTVAQKANPASPLLEQMVLTAKLAQQGLRLDFQAAVQQQVLRVQQAVLRLGKGQLAWAGELDLNAPSKFRANGQMQHFDPSQFGQYPVADLNGDLKIQGQLQPQWQVQVQSRLQPSRFLQQPLSGQATVQADAQHLTNLDLNVHFGPNLVLAKGDLGGVNDRLTWQLEGQDLSTFGWGGTVQAAGVVSGGFAHTQTSIDIQSRGIHKSGSAQLAAESFLQAQGQIVLRPALGGKLSLTAEHLNPAAWGAYPPGNVNAQAQMSYEAGSAPQSHQKLSLEMNLTPGSLMGLSLGGQLRFEAMDKQIQALAVAVSWGKNQLEVKQLAGPEPVFDWMFDLPQLPASLLPALTATNAVPPYFAAQGRWQGHLQAHTVQTVLTAYGIKTELSLAGAFTPGQGWQGNLQRLRSQLQGANKLNERQIGSLQAPVKLQWDAATKQFSAQAARFEFEGGHVQLESASWNPQQWRVKASASGVPLSLLGWLEPTSRLGGGLRGDLRFGLALDLNSAEHLNGSAHVVRESGDWRPGPALLQGAPLSQPSQPSQSSQLSQGLGLQTLQADLVIKDDALQLQAQVSGKQVGQAQIQLASKLARRDGRWGLPGNSPLQLQASATFDNIGSLAALAGAGEQLVLGGKMTLKLEGSGSIAEPVFSGNVTGDDLMLRWINEGLVLRNGALRAQWNGSQLQVQDLHFDGVQAQGVVQFAGAQTRLNMQIKATQLTLLSRPDRLLVVSGQSAVDFDAQGLRLTGQLKADRAQLELVAQDSPTLSDDIRFFRGQRLQEKTNPVLPLRVDLDMDLGEQFQVRGQGLDVRLTGKLHWQALEKRGPRLLGEVQVAEGTYRAYGQKLVIERSSINFLGAWDNPGLNIRAFRPRADARLEAEMEPQVGVELTGTLLAPQARLVSTPALPDSEKLAYLVLGHGLEGAGGQELSLLSAASTALFGQTNETLSNKLGLDELGVSYAKGVNNAVLTLGKRLSKQAFLRFEQGVGSASGLVKLRYLFSSRLSVQAQGGSNNAVDAFYSFRFD